MFYKKVLTRVLNSQSAFLLIKECINVKINWIARTVDPTATHFFLRSIFQDVVSELATRTEMHIPHPNLVSLPVILGGLGITYIAFAVVVADFYSVNDQSLFSQERRTELALTLQLLLDKLDTAFVQLIPNQLQGLQVFLTENFFKGKQQTLIDHIYSSDPSYRPYLDLLL
ncbi:hypothetical protein GEMRC1_012955 [Eukaryota sp. GEM-RC1]